MRNNIQVFSCLTSKKFMRTIFMGTAILGMIFIFYMPVKAAAETDPETTGARYYLPTYFSAPETDDAWAGQPEGSTDTTDRTQGIHQKTAPGASPAAKMIPIAPATGPGTKCTPAAVAETPAVASAIGLLSLKAPAQVIAGENFVLSLGTKNGFPFLPSEDAAFFESYESGKPQLAGIRTLDTDGTARLQLQETKAGSYSYSVLAGPFQDEATVTVLPGSPAAIFETQERLFLETGGQAAVEFAVEDAYGNKVAADCKGNKKGGKQLKVLITGPNNDTAKTLPGKEDFSITANPAGNFVVNFNTEEIGDYIVKATLPDVDVSAHSIVCARELGAVTDVELTVQDGKKPFLRNSENATQPDWLELGVVLRGENNFTKMLSPAEERNIIFSTDRPDLLRIEKTAESRALLTEKGKGGLATATVSYIGSGKGLQKTIPIYIAGDPVKIKPEIIVDDLLARVQLTLADKEGRLTWEKTKSYRLDIPADLKITAQKDFDRGKAEFVLKAEKYGCYTVGITADGGLSHNLQIVFLKKPKPAQKAVIFIGQEGYIKDGQPAKISPAPETCFGRVFVPVEFLYDAFGVKVDVFPRLNKIILQSPDEMEISIDGKALQLTTTSAKDGSTVKTPISTLFLQEKAGTYFVPAGIIARILGIEVDYLPKLDQIEHITFIRR
jgi:hypothetical protein